MGRRGDEPGYRVAVRTAAPGKADLLYAGNFIHLEAAMEKASGTSADILCHAKYVNAGAESVVALPTHAADRAATACRRDGCPGVGQAKRSVRGGGKHGPARQAKRVAAFPRGRSLRAKTVCRIAADVTWLSRTQHVIRCTRICCPWGTRSGAAVQAQGAKSTAE